MNPKFVETQNFLRLYTHMAGRSEVPDDYHFWCGLSVIAAAVSDRVWLEKFAGARLAPNLYTFLIGESGLGKGTSISIMLDLVKDIAGLNLYQGRATAQFLLDHMAKPGGRNGHNQPKLDNAKLFLVTPELAMSVGKGEQADTLIKVCTELYTGGVRTIQEGTRTRGGIKLENPCLNWLAGTTFDWLRDVIEGAAVEGGFVARIVPICAEPDFSVRYTRPEIPMDKDAVRAFLRARLSQLTKLEGEMTLSPKAREIEDSWYKTRDVPTDRTLVAWWVRQHDLVLKLCMLLALADNSDTVIEGHHMIIAQKLSTAIFHKLPEVIRMAGTTRDTRQLQTVLDVIQRSKRISHSDLLRKVAYKGLRARDLREIIDTLVQSRQVRVETGMRRSLWYTTTDSVIPWAEIGGKND